MKAASGVFCPRPLMLPPLRCSILHLLHVLPFFPEYSFRLSIVAAFNAVMDVDLWL